MRFRIHNLLLLTVMASIAFATARFGLLSFLFLGLPSCLILALGRPARPRYTVSAGVCAAVNIALGLVVLWHARQRGECQSVGFWLCFLGCYVWTAFGFLLSRMKKWSWVVYGSLVFVVLLLSLLRYGEHEYDSTRFRRRFITSVGGFKFVRESAVTGIVVSYIGDLVPVWTTSRMEAYSYPSHLPEALAKLPTREACEVVLECITNSENQCRHHQILLLEVLALSEQVEIDGWWEKHRSSFRVFGDPREAGAVVWGWPATVRKCFSKEFIDRTGLEYHLKASEDQEFEWINLRSLLPPTRVSVDPC